MSFPTRRSSDLVITFLPSSKHLLISGLQSPSAVILEPPKIKSDTVSPSISHEVMGLDAMSLVFWVSTLHHFISAQDFHSADLSKGSNLMQLRKVLKIQEAFSKFQGLTQKFWIEMIKT